MEVLDIEYSGLALKRRRKYLLLSLREVAEKIGISYGKLSEIENGKRPANTNELKKLKEVLLLREIKI